jgi:hypothetical protein
MRTTARADEADLQHFFGISRIDAAAAGGERDAADARLDDEFTPRQTSMALHFAFLRLHEILLPLIIR